MILGVVMFCFVLFASKNGNILITNLIPRNRGFSPGAADSDSTVSERTWLIDSTVAATNHGIPSTEHIPIYEITKKMRLTLELNDTQAN